MTKTPDDDFSEDQVLTGWALRFDGSKYAEETGWSHEDALAEAQDSRQLPQRPEERICLFFMLQRFLMKWGGEDLSRSGVEWWAFRELFLQTASLKVSDQWRAGEWYANWQTECAAHREEHIAFVRRVHAEIEYESV